MKTRLQRFFGSARGLSLGLALAVVFLVFLGLWFYGAHDRGEATVRSAGMGEPPSENAPIARSGAGEVETPGSPRDDFSAGREEPENRPETAQKAEAPWTDPGERGDWAQWGIPGRALPPNAEEQEAYILRRGLLTFDAEAVTEWLKGERQERVELRLFEDAGFLIEIYREDSHPGGIVSLHGRIDGGDLGTVVISLMDSRLVADVVDLAGGRSFHIKPWTDTGVHVVTEIDPQLIPPRVHVPVPIPAEKE